MSALQAPGGMGWLALLESNLARVSDTLTAAAASAISAAARAQEATNAAGSAAAAGSATAAVSLKDVLRGKRVKRKHTGNGAEEKDMDVVPPSLKKKKRVSRRRPDRYRSARG